MVIELSNKHRVTLLAGVFAAIAAGCASDSTETPAERGAESDDRDPSRLAEMTQRVLHLARAYERDRLPAQLETLHAAIDERRAAILTALKADPASAELALVPEVVRQTLPSEIRGQLETERWIDGELAWAHADDFAGEKSTDEFVLHAGDGLTYPVYAARSVELSPRRIKAKGFVVDRELFITSEGDVVYPSEEETLPSGGDLMSGKAVKKIGVILFNWKNDSSQPISVTAARAGMFTSATSTNAYHLENSFGYYELQGKTRVDGDVFGYYTIPYDKGVSCEYADNHAWADAADQAAASAGNDMTGYDVRVYVFPANSACGFAGRALTNTLGKRNWINGGGAYKTWVLGHEIGHSLGTHHAGSFKCKDSAGAFVPISNQCAYSEYGDPFEIMGNSGLNNHMFGWHKEHIGVMGAGNTLTASASGTYTLAAPIESASAGVQGIKIPRAKTDSTVHDWYYLDYRQAIGWDSNLASYPAQLTGVGIHLYPCSSPYVRCNGASTSSSDAKKAVLIDATPDGYFKDSALGVGKTFTDPTYGIKITTLSVSSSSATVKVELAQAPCARAAPTLSIAPSSQWGAAGATLSYTVSLRNNDTSGCGDSTFSVAAALASGFSQSPATYSMTAAPGVTTSRTISVASSATTAEGLYPFSQTATNTSATTYKATATASYNVTSQTQLTLSGTPYKVKGMQKVDLRWSGATSASVDVFRNGTKVTSTPNDGAHTDPINAKGGGSYTYKLCESGTTKCSANVNVAF